MSRVLPMPRGLTCLEPGTQSTYIDARCLSNRIKPASRLANGTEHSPYLKLKP
jgi:hypothetical protein